MPGHITDFLVCLFIYIRYGSFNAVVSNPDYMASNGTMIAEQLLGKYFEGIGHGLTEALSRNFQGGTEGNQENPQVGYPLFR
jgi:hypothetical protein